MSLTVGDPWSPQFYRAAASSSSSDLWSYYTVYESSSCDDVPHSTYASSICYITYGYYECSPFDYTGILYASNNITADILTYEVESCVADVDIDELVDSTYGDQAYIRYDSYVEDDCRTHSGISIHVVDGYCHTVWAANTSSFDFFKESWRVFVNDNGSITFQVFFNEDCSGDVDLGLLYEREELASNECVNGTIISTTAKAGDSSAQAKGTSDSVLDAGAIAGIVVACVVAVGLVAIGYVAWRRHRQSAQYQPSPSTTEAMNAPADDGRHPYHAKD